MNQSKIKLKAHTELTVAAVSLNTHALDLERHTNLILKSAVEAKKSGALLILYPELSLTGYGCEDLFLSPNWLSEVEHALVKLIESFPKGVIGCVGLPLHFEGRCFNTMAVISRNKLHGISAKQQLANDGVHYEARWFTPWVSGEVTSLDFHGHKTQLGSLVYQINNARFCFEICEDAWVSERVALSYKDFTPSLILSPSASHFALEKHAERQNLVKEGSKLLNASYVYCNLLGCEAGRVIYDGGNMFAYNGDCLHQGERFSFEPYYLDVVSCPFIVKSLGDEVKNSPNLINVGELKTKTLVNQRSTEGYTPFVQAEEVLNAIMLGLWDWQLKTKTQGFSVSLSGGADSSLCAVCVFLAHEKARETLGEEQYCSMLKIKNSDLSQFLTTAYQKTKNSSQETEEAARILANAIGSTHLSWSIDDLVSSYKEKIENALGLAKLTFEEHDVVLQNIQARVRSPSIWMIANLKNQLLIATSNLSESCVGYCTMDGDTSGVLSPIAGLSKSFILELNQLVATKGIRFLSYSNNYHQVQALKNVTELTPSAELRPELQLDEEDLMPYEVLDFIRRCQQVKHLTKDSIKIRLLKQAFSKPYSKKKLVMFLERYFKLYQRNQWKRERIATGFHLEKDSCCPKTYRRYPVLSNLAVIE